MNVAIEPRETSAEHLTGLKGLYSDAFPEEELYPLVEELLSGNAPVLSYVAVSDGDLAGHVLFTHCTIAPGNHPTAVLAPLCAAPRFQKQGIGSQLVRSGLEALKEKRVQTVMVLGDPNYYGRFGFEPDYGVKPPCPIPEEYRDAWQSLRLDGAPRIGEGDLVVPQEWRDPALWSA